MKESIKNLRVKIDGLSQLVKELKPYKDLDAVRLLPSLNSHEIEKCYDSLVLAKAWLGKVLGELGIESPYVNDGNRKTVEDIEPAADTSKLEFSKTTSAAIMNNIIAPQWGDYNYIQKVDWLREEIETVNILCHNTIREYISHTILTAVEGKNSMPTIQLCNCADIVKIHLTEARFWLGFELSRCKKEVNK